MTTLQILQRIGRRAKDGDITRFSLTEIQDVLQAANGAMQIFYNLAPSYFKELTEGFTLPAPRDIAALTVVNGSNLLSSDVFDPSEIGRSVVIAGDANWNQVISTDRLLNAYLGPTGTPSATVYGDAVYSERYPFDRVIGNPQYSNQATAPVFRDDFVRVNEANGWWPYQNQVGFPQVWWPQFLGNSQGNEPLMVLRFAPAPSTTYAIKIRMAYWAKRLTLTDYHEANVVPVPDQFIESIWIPLAHRELMSSPIWTPRDDDQRIVDRAKDAETMARLQIGQPAAPQNYVGTPVGY